MRLGDLISALDPAPALAEGAAALEISGLAIRADRAGPGTLFLCVPGFTADGHDFAPEAVGRGAAALVCERPLDLGVPEVVVPSTRAAMAPLAARLNGDPTAELDVCGITGTNGKTTTAFLVRTILEAAGHRTGLLGTVRQVVGGQVEDVERTTPEALELQATFRRMLDAGDTACAMEVSSHALALGRADSIRFACAAFTNLTQDHLDFHADMDEYFAAKRRLFDAEPPPAAAVVNLDDPRGAGLARELAGCVTVSAAGQAAADWRAEEIEFDVRGSRFLCVHPAGTVQVEVPLPGGFNVSNALVALACAAALGVDPDRGAAALAGAETVPGRFEPVDEGQAFAVVVDYAHTPDSLDNVLRAARRLGAGRLICVFGCGGDRDRAKRPLMGRVAAELADLAVLSSDNPRSEDPIEIIRQVLDGMDAAATEVEPDRRAAIRLALERAEPGDVVVIAGKGHEQGQEFEAGRTLPFDDRQVAREELRRLAGATP